MSASGRWIVVAMAALLVVLLVALARGDDHHRGDEVGSLGVPGTSVVQPEGARHG
jgi:hypothetical protein